MKNPALHDLLLDIAKALGYDLGEGACFGFSSLYIKYFLEKEWQDPAYGLAFFERTIQLLLSIPPENIDILVDVIQQTRTLIATKKNIFIEKAKKENTSLNPINELIPTTYIQLHKQADEFVFKNQLTRMQQSYAEIPAIFEAIILFQNSDYHYQWLRTPSWYQTAEIPMQMLQNDLINKKNQILENKLSIGLFDQESFSQCIQLLEYYFSHLNLPIAIALHFNQHAVALTLENAIWSLIDIDRLSNSRLTLSIPFTNSADLSAELFANKMEKENLLLTFYCTETTRKILQEHITNCKNDPFWPSHFVYFDKNIFNNKFFYIYCQLKPTLPNSMVDVFLHVYQKNPIYYSHILLFSPTLFKKIIQKIPREQIFCLSKNTSFFAETLLKNLEKMLSKKFFFPQETFELLMSLCIPYNYTTINLIFWGDVLFKIATQLGDLASIEKIYSEFNLSNIQEHIENAVYYRQPTVFLFLLEKFPKKFWPTNYLTTLLALAKANESYDIMQILHASQEQSLLSSLSLFRKRPLSLCDSSNEDCMDAEPTLKKAKHS